MKYINIPDDIFTIKSAIAFNAIAYLALLVLTGWLLREVPTRSHSELGR